MRFRAYQGARPGIMSMMQALNSPGGSTSMDAMRDLAYLDSSAASARGSDAQAALAEDELAARGGLPAALAHFSGQIGADPEAWATIFRASANPNLRDLTLGHADLNKEARTDAAMQAAHSGDVSLMNRINSVLGVGQYHPHTFGEYGTGNQETGQVTPSGSSIALANERNAAAYNNAASARRNDALARAAGSMTVPPGYSVIETPDPNAPPVWQTIPTLKGEGDNAIITKLDGALMRQSPQELFRAPYAPGSNNLSDKQKTYAAHIEQGMPPAIAHGLAYGSLEKINDPASMRVKIVDWGAPGGMQEVANVSSRGIEMTDYGKRLYSQKGARGGAPQFEQIEVIAPDGTRGFIPAEDLPAAMQEGYRRI